MTDAPADREPLEVLADEFLTRQRRGECPTVEEYATAHPDLAEEIRELFPTIVAMERLKARSERSAEGLASLGPMKLERLGDFRIIREIGRGGMGIVFEAEQESLGRRVALKVLPRQALLEQRQLLRFRREARIASRLHHTNIVQVYGVGEQEGFHYYIMQYVQGVGLDRVIQTLNEESFSIAPQEPLSNGLAAPEDPLLRTVIDRLRSQSTSGHSILSDPAYFRAVAQIGAQAADALAYAHDQGTLHRDIKPSNLLLDDQGVVWITDFGLARASHAPEVTQTGDLTGTLRYLAPERFAGKTDARSDLYSLGLTLYELLALKPAYDEADRSALVKRVTQEAPPRPREVNPHIPRDLETIVLKAMAREPEHRYASAAELAQDLRRFLEDRPVLARRIGPLGQLWRWCRRNKAVASLAASTLFLIIAVAVLATIGYVRTTSALSREAEQRRRATDALLREARQRKRAEAVVDVAGNALDRVFARLGPSRAMPASLTVGGGDGTSIQVIGQPVISHETAALLEEMLPFYDQLAEQTGDDRTLQRRAATARRRVGDIRQRLGQYEQALAAYRRSIETLNSLARIAPNDRSLVLGLAEAHNEMGRTCLLMRQSAVATQAHLRALELLNSTTDTSSGPERFELARTHFFLGQRVPAEPGARTPTQGRPTPSDQRPLPRDDRSDDPPARDRREPPPRDDQDHPLPSGDRPPRGDEPPRRPDRPPDPDRRARNQHIRQSISLLTALLSEQPKNPDYRHLLALCYREVAAPDRVRENELGKAIEILEALATDFPQIPDYALDLSETYATTEGGGPGQFAPDALDRLQKAMTISQQLTSRHPNVPEYLASQARIHHRLGEVLRQMRQLDQADANDRKALDLQAQLATSYPEVTTYQVWESAYRNSLADLLLRRSNPSETRDLAEKNITRMNALQKAHPELWYVSALLAESHQTLAAALRQLGQPQQADQAAARAQELRSSLPNASRDSSTKPVTPPTSRP